MIKQILYALLMLVIAAGFMSACATDTPDPVSPELECVGLQANTTRQLWGLWDVEIIPDGTGSAELVFTPLRSSQMHMNVVGLLEGSGEPALAIDPPATIVDGVLDVDIRLMHPYDIVNLCGFDVRGILIGHGPYGGFSQSLFFAGPDDLQLLNADGHTTLWNPTDYSGSGYIDGKLGQPDALADFTATLNGYKYFAKGLLPDTSVADMPKDDRGVFLAFSFNSRHYKIRLGDKGLTFQYAIDANWWPPTQPVEVPASFDIERANCPEPYHMSTYIGPGIAATGGSAEVVVDVFDWQKDCDQVILEAPVLINSPLIMTNPEDMGDFVRFTTVLSNENIPETDFANILIRANGIDPESGTTYFDYRLFRLPLPRVPVGGVVITLEDDMAYKTIGVEYIYAGVAYDYSTGGGAPVDYSDTDGPWDFTAIPEVDPGFRAALATDDPEVAAFVGDFSSSITHLWKTQALLDGEPQLIYMAEVHNASQNKLQLWGVYEEYMMGGSVAFDPPVVIPYPLVTTTHYSASETYDVIPGMLTFTVSFERWGMGQGIAFMPADPGIYGWGWDFQACLEIRSIASIETGGAFGEGLLGTILVYEWIGDDGTTVGTILSANDPASEPNFDESTFEILKASRSQVLRSID